mgnify:CR=1 FL=1
MSRQSKSRKSSKSCSKDASWETNKVCPRRENKKFTKCGNKNKEVNEVVNVVKKQVNKVLHIKKVHIRPVDETLHFYKKVVVRHPTICKVKNIKKPLKTEHCRQDYKCKKNYEKPDESEYFDSDSNASE